MDLASLQSRGVLRAFCPTRQREGEGDGEPKTCAHGCVCRHIFEQMSHVPVTDKAVPTPQYTKMEVQAVGTSVGPTEKRYHNGSRNAQTSKTAVKLVSSGARYRYGSFGFFPSETCSSVCANYF